jgi:hypothetical protein
MVIVAVLCLADQAHAVLLKAPPSKSCKTSVKMPSARKNRKRIYFFAIFVKVSQYNSLFVACDTIGNCGYNEYASNDYLYLMKAALSTQTPYSRDR